MRRAVVLLALLLAVAGCSSGGDSGSSSAPTEAVAKSSAPDLSALVALCDAQCQPLIDQQKVCPTGTTNLTACGMPLAQGADRVTAVQKGIATIGAQPSVDLTELVSAIAKEQAAYQTWSDNGGCTLAYDLTDPRLAEIFPGGRTGMFTCAAEAATVGLTQASVGLTLRNAAHPRTS